MKRQALKIATLSLFVMAIAATPALSRAEDASTRVPAGN
jgi:hypothetical protein